MPTRHRKTVLFRRETRFFCAVVGVLVSGSAFASAQETDAVSGSYAEPIEEFYFPTDEEAELIGGPESGRHRRNFGSIQSLGGDNDTLTASGLWGNEPYENAPDSFYERNDRIFGPAESFLGVFTPREMLSLENSDPEVRRTSLFVDPGLPFTQDFDPDLATFKLGPFYGDILRIGAEVLWTDFDGDGTSSSLGDDDGWLSIISLDARAYIQLTENLFLSISGSVYYLPGENEAGFYFGNGGNYSYLRLEHEQEIGNWAVRAYDHFRVTHPLSEVLDEVEVDEIDQAGRYRVGRPDADRSTAIFEDENVYFVNEVGIEGTTQLTDNWKLDLGYEHVDVWRSFGFDHLINYDRAGAEIEYNGEEWNITPYAAYNVTALDDYQDWRHTTWLGARARVTENTSADGRVGYVYQDNDDAPDTESFLWQVGINQELSYYTRHSLYGGTTTYDSDFGNNYLLSFVRYTLSQQLGAGITASAYVQWYDQEDLSGEDILNRDGWLTGVLIGASLGNSTWISLSANYDFRDENEGRGISDRERLLLRGTLTHLFLPNWSGRLSYQYEDFRRDGGGSYTEHLVRAGIFHTF